MHPDHDYDEEQNVREREPADSPFLYNCAVCGRGLDPSEFKKHKKLHNELTMSLDDNSDHDNSDSADTDNDNSVEEEKEEKSSVTSPSNNVQKRDLSHVPVNTPGRIVYRCSVCNHTSNCLYHIQNHMRKHSGVKPFLCKVEGCGKTFCDPQGLRNHERVTHSDERPYFCGFCGKTFKRRKHLTEHEVSHNPEAPRDFLCHLCDKAFTLQKILRVHLLSHTNADDQYKCNFCPKSFKIKNTFRLHLKEKHPNLSTSDDVKGDTSTATSSY